MEFSPHVTVDWHGIRPIDGSQQRGFEELCCQLANLERPRDARFLKKGAPDAGVECLATLQDDSEWGWQAKYFDRLGESQLSQLNESVRKAIDNHPRLVKYYVCVPFDLADARTSGRKSAKDRWDDRVRQWTDWAQALNREIQFVFWGSFELRTRLARPENQGRLRFWFDVKVLDETWFQDRLRESIESAGPRYSPEVHFELPIAKDFEIVGRTDRFVDDLKAMARPLRRALDTLSSSLREKAPSAASLEKDMTALSSSVSLVLASLGRLGPVPAGPFPLKELADTTSRADGNANSLGEAIWREEKDYDAHPDSGPQEKENPFSRLGFYLRSLRAELAKLRDATNRADELSNAPVIVLEGEAGTGKTHLLCDIAGRRIREHRPTVLLMGQRFLTKDDPWTQALHHLDLANVSIEEFVGAMECAAQIAGCRALLLIDALNEGAGRWVWPQHLPAFLAHISKSEWISVVVSTRTSYEDLVIPKQIAEAAGRLEHLGFAGHEYDASKAFFDYYGIEAPSVPLLIQEFRNPLFLKVLCKGLQDSGQTRFPSGFQGISNVFGLFLDSVNNRLATNLNYNHKHGLIREALGLVIDRLVEMKQQWLPLAEAEQQVNSCLPGREFDRSLFHGLVSEGVLAEDLVPGESGKAQDIVRFTYERLSDYLIAERLLDRYLDMDAPEKTFAKGGSLAYINDRKQYLSSGIMEALCVLVPERTGKELARVTPKITRRFTFAYAFRRSLVWRSRTAFSDDTVTVLRAVNRTDADVARTLDEILWVAVDPEHPFNAAFIHERLSKSSMANRDAWWSIYLHRAYGAQGAVDRLVEWGWSVPDSAALDERAVDLAATILAWMLSTSNRHLRDRATKALTNLLTNRLQAADRLVKSLASVDDPYISERLYASAYGCAMRSNDVDGLGVLAQTIYDIVFREGIAPAHILLRDYARGVVERAISRGCTIDGPLDRIRPPYGSTWPHIPTEDEIRPYMPDGTHGAWDSGDNYWSQNRIWHSVFDDDFASYVIGTNGAYSNWLSLGLDKPLWVSWEERLENLIKGLSPNERHAWAEFDAADTAATEDNLWFLRVTPVSEEPGANEVSVRRKESSDKERDRDAALSKLLSTLSKKHRESFENIMATKEKVGSSRPPSLDLSMIQRYIVWRVFELGWTKERFGYFDRFDIGFHGRSAAKAERIGKKYQWIAYHEIMAYVADNFQYRDSMSDDKASRHYEGPWQESLRDIDPSCTLRTVSGGTSFQGHALSWWCDKGCDSWTHPYDPELWANQTDDLPPIRDIIAPTRPEDKSKWLNINGFFLWSEPVSPDLEPHSIECREVSFLCFGYLTKAGNASSFMSWAESVDFWGRWMPEPATEYRMFLGEHVWSPAALFLQDTRYDSYGWAHPPEDCPVPVRVTSLQYSSETSGFDCSTDESFSLRLPSSFLINSMNLHWTGHGGQYITKNGQVGAYDPTVCLPGPTSLLLRYDDIVAYLAREGLSLVWTILGEKRVLPAGLQAGCRASSHLSGAYCLERNGLQGFMNLWMDAAAGGNPRLVKTIRSS